MNMIGVDASAVLGRGKETDDDSIIGGCGYGCRNARGHAFAAWLHGQRLAVSASMKDRPWSESWTHELWSTHEKRQIDYILYDEVRNDALEDVGIIGSLDGKLDHRGVFSRWHLEPYDCPRKQRSKVQVGWQPRLDAAGEPTEYHALLDAALNEDMADLTSTIVRCAAPAGMQHSRPRREHSEEVQALFNARRDEENPDQRKILSKKLWKALRKQRRQRAEEDIDALTRLGGGLGKLRQTMQKRVGTKRVTGIRDNDGHMHTDPETMSEVFALFYEDLYRELGGASYTTFSGAASQTAPVTVEEVKQSLGMLKNNRTGAEDGLVAEMLKTGHAGLIQALATLFNDILQDTMPTPDTWKCVKLKLIFKKGDPEMPKNYRPISIIPVLAKLYSTILYQRLRALLDSQLSDEQYGFRKGRGCADAVHILRTVIEKSAEWGEELWIATLDVEKAFDRVHHSSLFDVLMKSGADASTVAALYRWYADLQASAVLWPGEESRSFQVERGVRQGDPLSPLLFNLVINQVLEEARVMWMRRGYGTNVGQFLRGERLTHVAFADDMTLVSRSWLSMKRMLSTLRESLASRGLTLHPSKCKLQTNLTEWQRRGEVDVEDGFSVEVLGGDSNLLLLGTVLNLHDASQHEVANRIAAAWRMFWGMKAILLTQKISTHRRLRIFDATVSSCATWCCESWTPRADELRQLESARRSMLRKIVCPRRASAEEWLDWIARATHKALDWACRARVREWCRLQFEKKWHWAGHVARSSASSWLYKVTTWRDSAWQAMSMEMGASREVRPSRRRWMKWEDQLRRFCTLQGLPPWEEMAANRDEWKSHAHAFKAWCV